MKIRRPTGKAGQLASFSVRESSSQVLMRMLVSDCLNPSLAPLDDQLALGKSGIVVAAPSLPQQATM